MIELDHKHQKVYFDRRSFVAPDDVSQLKDVSESLKTRMSNPIVSSYVDTEKISFERWLESVSIIFLLIFSSFESFIL